MVIVPLPRRFYEGMVEAFRTEKVEWRDSKDIIAKYDRKAHDYVYLIAPSAVSAMVTWATLSAASHISTSGGELWAALVSWRAKQPDPPLEPAPPPYKSGVTLSGQLPLFADLV